MVVPGWGGTHATLVDWTAILVVDWFVTQKGCVKRELGSWLGEQPLLRQEANGSAAI